MVMNLEFWFLPFFFLFCLFIFFFFRIDISIANIVVNDELCGSSSIENFAKNNPFDYVVRHFLHGCNSTKPTFRYIQSGEVWFWLLCHQPIFFFLCHLNCVTFSYFNNNFCGFFPLWAQCLCRLSPRWSQTCFWR